MEIGIRGSDKNWSAGKVTRIAFPPDLLTDQAPGEYNHAAKALRTPCYKLCTEAGALRKAEKVDVCRCYPRHLKLVKEYIQLIDCRRQPGLIAF